MTQRIDFHSFIDESLNRLHAQNELLKTMYGNIQIYHWICSHPDLYKLFLNEIFNSSLFVEEGRQVRVRIALGLEGFEPQIAFLEEIDFVAKRVVKMAPIVNLWDRQLLVRPNPQGELKIVGIIQQPQKGWESINSRNGNNSYSLSFLSIEIHGPGEIRIEYPISSQFNKGESGIFSKLISINAFKDWFKKIALQFDKLKNVEVQTFQNGINLESLDGVDSIQFFTNSLNNILKFMREGKHGGCIAIVPDDDTSWQNHLEMNDYKIQTNYFFECLHNRFKCKDVWDALTFVQMEHSPILTEPFVSKDKMGVADSVDKLHFAEKELDSAERFISSLTYIDGAVVLSSSLNIIGFGARFTSKLEPQEGGIQNVGMRHKSAHDFCYKVKGAVAIVVSQDGGITVFANNGENSCLHEKIILDYVRTDL